MVPRGGERGVSKTCQQVPIKQSTRPGNASSATATTHAGTVTWWEDAGETPT